MTKNEAFTRAAAIIDWEAERQLDTLALNLRVQGYDDDEIRAILREARVINAEAIRDGMRELERLINEECVDDSGRLMFVPMPLSWSPTVH